MSDPAWLDWAKRLQAVAQTGLTYAQNIFDEERYTEIRRIASEMMASGTGIEDATRIADLFAREKGYATPKLDVRAAVFRDGRILLVKEREDGCWTLPGGWADVGDAPSVAAVREVREESGYEVAARKLALVFDRDRHGHPPLPFHVYKLFFVCDLVGGAPASNHETEGIDFFAEDAIPPLSLTRVVPEEIGLLFEHHRHPEWPTTFD
jgi:ADP-ribose pyrophosphatase YjhB (NUDIX family)